MISVVTATYNRSHTLERAIDSLLRQTYREWELIVVDDGSTDGTGQILERYADERRIRVFRHPRNRGVCAAKNTGLDQVRGEWFTMLDSDDELVPAALESLLAVPARIDPTIDAVTCNCLDSSTGMFSGHGVEHDGYVGVDDVVNRMRGEHWGITRTELLGSLRFNEAITGGEDVVWFQISRRAKRYYLHEALRIYHTEGNDRVSAPSTVNLESFIRTYAAYGREAEYLALLRTGDPRHFRAMSFNIALAHALSGRRRDALNALRNTLPSVSAKTLLCLCVLVVGRRWGRAAVLVASLMR